MDTGFLTLLMTVLGPLLLGIAIAYGILNTRRFRNDPAAQDRIDRATERAYRAEERESRKEGAGSS